MSAAPSTVSQAETQYDVTFGVYNQTEGWIDRRRLSWAALADILTRHMDGPKAGSCIVPATFAGDRRHKGDARKIDLVFLDSDGGATLAEISAALSARRWAGIIASTHSHMSTRTIAKRSHWERWYAQQPHGTGMTPAAYLVQDKGYLPRVAAGATMVVEDGDMIAFTHSPCPKFRVALPLARPWVADSYPDQDAANVAWKERIEALAAALGLAHDQACTDTSRLFYLPRRPTNGAAAEAVVLDGEPCDIFALPSANAAHGLFAGTTAPPRKPQPEARPEFSDKQTGELIDLPRWARSYGARFEIVKALRARSPQVFVGKIGDAVKHHIRCANEGDHTNAGADEATFVVNASESRAGHKGFAYHCRHGHCDGRDRLFFLGSMLEQGWLKAEDLTAPAFLTGEDDIDSTAPGQTVPGEKRPLFRPLPTPPDYPVAALGPLRGAAEAIQMQSRAPIAMCGNSVLAAATLAVQAQRDVELPGGGRKPLTAIYVSVADSGERKTTVDKLALAPVYRMEEVWRGEHDAAMHSFANDKEAWKEARETAKKKPKGDRAAIRAGLDKVGPEPKPPPHPMLLVADPTPEALVLHLRDSRPWAGVFTAEGGILVGGAAFNDEARMRTGALFNTLWDGDPIRRTRVGTGASFLPGRRCTAHVMLQPVVADKLFGDPMLDGIGMLARTLLVAPESTAGTRMYREAPAECQVALAEYGARLDHLLRRPPATKGDDATVLDPPVLRLHLDAARMWIAFHDVVEAQLLPGGAYATIKAFGAKIGEHAGRLAAVLTVYADPDAMEVPATMMACGITLAQHYATEMLRLQGASTVSPDLRLAARLLAWWQARPDTRCHAAAIYQRGPSALRDNSTARRIVGILEEHGFVRRLPAGTELDDGPRRDAWELLP
jgi:Protein of unknown function (DUF3987)